MSETPQDPTTAAAELHFTVTFGGGGVNPIQTAARFVLGIGEMSEQIGERFNNESEPRFELEVTSVQAGSSASGSTPAALAVLGVFARRSPDLSNDGLLHLITRLAEQIAVEAGTAVRVTEVGSADSSSQGQG